MLTIRLQRVGRKNDPSFRVVVVESKRGPKSGSFLEVVGSYDARTNRADLVDGRIKEWMAKGATVSDTLHNLLITKGIVEGKKRNVLPRKTVAKQDLPAQAEEVVAAAPSEAAAETVVTEEPKVEAVEETSTPDAETPAEEKAAE